MHLIERINTAVRLLICLSFSCLLILAACKKSGSGTDDEDVESEVLITPKAQPVGPAITKVIGPAGGTLSTPGDSVVMIVPAGAVSIPTTFSIQPVESTLQVIEGKVNYELLPHSVTFAKPIQVIFKYDPELFKFNQDVLVVASRNEEGKWMVLPTALDKTNKTVTVEKTSFSEFEIYEKYIIRPENLWVNSGESIEIKLGVLYSKWDPSSDDGVLTPLIPSFEFGNTIYHLLSPDFVQKISNWRIVEGPGKIEATNSFKSIAKYTAPDLVDTNAVVTIEATIEGVQEIKDPKAPGGVRNTGKLIIRTQIVVLGGWIKLAFDGKTYILKHHLAIGAVGEHIAVGGENEDGNISVAAGVFFSAGGAGSFSWGDKAGSASGGVSFYNMGYNHGHLICNTFPVQHEYSSGKLTFDNWSKKTGEIISGSFNGNFFTPKDDGCQFDSKSFSVQFKIPRSGTWR
ncbi:MAG: hypothetical protein QM731_03380 [Chitinophagaceae bacterium]